MLNDNAHWTPTVMNLVLESDLKCPACGRVSTEVMPTNACVRFHPCPDCGTVIQPKEGDCCVFCSYGTVPCPPVQIDGRGCAGTGCTD